MSVDEFSDPIRPGEYFDGNIKRDRWGRYVIPDPETGKERSWTRATTHAKTISDTFALNRWHVRMTAKGLVLRPDLFTLVASTDDKDELNSICERAQEAAGSKIGANLGTAVHTYIESYNRGNGSFKDAPEQISSDLHAYARTMRNYRLTPLPQYVESVVVCPEIGAAGKLDYILTTQAPFGRWEEPGVLCIGDAKTAANIGYSWLEVAIQLAIYSRSTHIWDPETQTLSPMPAVDQDEAIVMHVPVQQSKCELYRINIRQGWTYALLAAQIREARKDQKLAARVDPISSALGLDYAAQIREATCRADLSAIWEEAMSRGMWNSQLVQQGRDRLEELRG